MNLIFEPLPASLEVAGREYPMRTDFREWVKIELLMQDRLLSGSEKTAFALNLCYVELPDDRTEAARAMLWFFACGHPSEAKESDKDAPGAAKVYDLDQDAEYIYAAFLAQYGIDLSTAKLHWWQFRALFKSLTDSNLFVKILGYRSVVIDDKMLDSQKQFYTEMKQLYALDDGRSEEEKERDFANALIDF